MSSGETVQGGLEQGGESGGMQQNVTLCNTFEYVEGVAGDDSTSGLTDLQQRAMDLLLQGRADAAIARELRMSRVTLFRWKTANEPFIAELARRRRLAWNTTADRLQHLAHRALATLARQLGSDSAVESRQAAQLILRLSPRIQPQSPPTPQAVPVRGKGSSGTGTSESD